MTDNTETQKSITRFIKFFLIKSIQTIVQSRLSNKKVKTECRLPSDGELMQSSGADWFNLQIQDNAEILSKTHPLLLETESREHFTISLEIYLETGEEVSLTRLPLEVWVIEVDRGSSSQANGGLSKDVHTVYNRLGLMMKSVLTVTRVTPAYRIARRRVPNDGFQLGYSMTTTETDDYESLLGEKYRQLFVGKVALTPVATEPWIKINIFYRTKMEIFETQPDTLLLKSDHYSDDSLTTAIKPAFYSDVVISDEIVDVENEFLSLFVVKKTVVEEPVVEPEVIPEVKQQQPGEELQLPFSVSSSQQISSSSETELLNLFEDCRLAPKNLFNSSDSNVKEDLEQIQKEFQEYDEFFKEFLE